MPLEKAASLGKSYKEIVSILLDFGATADLAPKGDQIHILHQAAMYDMIDLARYCLSQCQIDMVSRQNRWYPRRYGDFPPEMTPLGYASAEGNVEMIEFLLNQNAPYDLGKPGSAHVWVAAYMGHAEAVDVLLTRFGSKHNAEEKSWFLENDLVRSLDIRLSVLQHRQESPR